jgi:porphobilinogen deaminase
MDITGEMTERLPLDIFPSAAGQGAIAIVAKEGNTELIKLLQTVEDTASRAQITAERSLVLKLEGRLSCANWRGSSIRRQPINSQR